MKHVHADAMLAYAQDAMETYKPWERWESNFHRSSSWIPMEQHPAWLKDHNYRRKPRTIKVNGFDVPEPMREVPESGCCVFSPSLDDKHFVYEFVFTGASEWRARLFQRGLIHETREAAAKHAMAMCGIDPAIYKEEE